MFLCHLVVTGWLVCLGGPPDVTVYLFEHMAYCLLLVPCALLSRMRGLDHLTFGDFVEALACSPARVAGVPRAVLAEAAVPPVMADKAATQGGLETSSVAPSGPRPFPGVSDCCTACGIPR